MSLSSPFANLFNALTARLQSQVPEIAWIDHDLGQLEAFDGERPPVAFPCLLIDMNTTDFAQYQGYQQGNMNIVLRLAFDQYQQTHAEVPEYVKEQALQYYEIEHRIHLALQSWNNSGALVNAMIRVSAASEKREDDNFRVRRLVYFASFADASVTT